MKKYLFIAGCAIALISVSCSLARAVPGGISNLTAITGDNEGEIKLSWTAPGNDGTKGTVGGYLVKYATSQINSSDFNSSWVTTYTRTQSWEPVSGGNPESQILTGLVPGTTQFFAIKGSSNTSYGVWYSSVEYSVNNANFAWVKMMKPGAITNLSAIAGYKEVTLNWTAPGDDGTAGSINDGQYDVRCSSIGPFVDDTDWDKKESAGYPYRIVWDTDTAPGNSESRVVTGLTNGVTYYFAIKTRDENTLNGGNWSVLNDTSPVPFGMPYNSSPNSFKLSTPTIGAIVSTRTPTFKWEANGDSDAGDTINYEIWLSSSDKNFVIKSTYSVSYSSYTPQSNLVENATYWWIVKAIDSEFAETWTDNTTWYIRINAVDSPPIPASLNLSSPTDTEIVNTKTPTFDWTDATDPDPGDYIASYTIWYSTRQDFDPGVRISSGGLTISSYTSTSDLVENATYWWSVRAIDNDGYITVSDTWTIRINSENTAPGFFDLTESSGIVKSTTPTFDWQDSLNIDPGDIITYTIWYSTREDFDPGVLISSAGLAISSYTPTTGLIENATYWWSVRAVDTSLFWSSMTTVSNSTWAIRINALDEPPKSFELTIPTNTNIVNTKSPTFDWADAIDPDPGDNIASYTIWYSTRQDFDASVRKSSEGLTISSFTPVGALLELIENSTYWWSVRAIDNNNGYQTVSNTWTVRINATDEPPNPLSLSLSTPANTSIVNTKSPTFDWPDASDPDPGDYIASYTIWYSTRQDFDPGVRISSGGLTISSYTSTSDLVENATYWWSIRAIDNNNGYMTVSDTWTVRINSENTAPGFFDLTESSGILTTSTPTFNWGVSIDIDPGDIITYTIWYSTREDFDPDVRISSAGLAVSSYTPTIGLIENATYWWSARAVATSLFWSSMTTVSNSTWAIRINALEEPPKSFELTIPTNTNIVNTKSPIFDWADAIDPDPGDNIASYTIWYSTREDFGVKKSSEGLTISSFTPVGALLELIENATYWWSVRAIDNDGYETVSDTWTVRINHIDEPPYEFYLSSPADTEVVDTKKPTFVWENMGDPDPGDYITYTLHYTQDSDFGFYTKKDLAYSSYTVTSDLEEDTTYYWRVYAVDNDSLVRLCNQTAWRIRINADDISPSTFSLVSPENAFTVSVCTPTFDWQDSSTPDPGDKITYTLYYSTYADFISSTTEPGLGVSDYTPGEDLIDGATYYWKVKAFDGGTGETWSNTTWYFTINYDDPPSTFTLLSPINISTGKTPTFSWTDSLNYDPWDSITYTILCSTRQDFDPVYISSAGLTGSSFTATGAFELIDNSTYWWVVKAEDNDGDFVWSNQTATFMTNVSSENPSSFSLFYPVNGDTVTVLTPEFNWDNSIDPDPKDSVTYVLYYSTYANFSSSTTKPGLEVSSYTPVGDLADNATYYWKVKATGSDDSLVKWSNEINWKFWTNVINDTPTAFNLTSPGNNTTTGDVTPTFSWGNSIDIDPNDSVTYTIWYSTCSNFIPKTSVSGLADTSCTPSANLNENAYYYWKVRADDLNGGYIWSNQTDWKIFIRLLHVPEIVEGIKGYLSSDRKSFSLSWNPVTHNTDGSAISDLGGYNIYRSDTISTVGDGTPVATVSADTLTWKDTGVNRKVYYYMLRAVDDSGIESGDSVIADSSRDENIIVVSEDRQAIAVIPNNIRDALYSENNSYGTDLKIVMERNTDDEKGRVIRSWEFKVLKCSDNKEVKNFRFDRPLVNIQLAYDSSLQVMVGAFGKAVFHAPQQSDSQVGIFWHNGIEFVKLGGQIDSNIKALSIKSRYLGVYRVQQVQRATEFELSWTGTIGPTKVFTPNRDGINDIINFVFENPRESIYSGVIYDITGSVIADMSLSEEFDYSLMWDGNNRDGEIADKGVYIYQIKTEGKTINGTVILAK